MTGLHWRSTRRCWLRFRGGTLSGHTNDSVEAQVNVLYGQRQSWARRGWSLSTQTAWRFDSSNEALQSFCSHGATRHSGSGSRLTLGHSDLDGAFIAGEMSRPSLRAHECSFPRRFQWRIDNIQRIPSPNSTNSFKNLPFYTLYLSYIFFCEVGYAYM